MEKTQVPAWLRSSLICASLCVCALMSTAVRTSAEPTAYEVDAGLVSGQQAVQEQAGVLSWADPALDTESVNATLERPGLDASDYALPTVTADLLHYLSGEYRPYENELSLDEALELSLTFNHALNQKRLEAEAACADVDVKWSDMLPQLTMIGKALYRDDNFTDQAGFIVTGEDLQAQLIFNLTQRIYDFGLTNRLVDQAEARHAIAYYAVDMAEQQLVHDLTEAHINFSLALGQAKIRRDEVDLAREFLRQINIQFEVGTVPRLDVIRVESRLESANEALMKALATLGDATAYYYSLLGVEDQRYVPEIVTADLLDSKLELEPLDELVTIALDTRPELQMQYGALFAQESAKSLKRNRPILEAYANALYYGENQSFQGTDNYEYGLQLVFPLYTGGKDRAERRKADLELKAIYQGILDLEARIELDVTTAWNRMYSARSTVESSRKNLELTGEALRAASVGYRAGVTTYIELEDALDRNVAAALVYLFSLAEVKKAELNLLRSEGFPQGYPGDSRGTTPDRASMLEVLGGEMQEAGSAE